MVSAKLIFEHQLRNIFKEYFPYEGNERMISAFFNGYGNGFSEIVLMMLSVCFNNINISNIRMENNDEFTLFLRNAHERGATIIASETFSKTSDECTVNWDEYHAMIGELVYSEDAVTQDYFAMESFLFRIYDMYGLNTLLSHQHPRFIFTLLNDSLMVLTDKNMVSLNNI